MILLLCIVVLALLFLALFLVAISSPKDDEMESNWDESGTFS